MLILVPFNPKWVTHDKLDLRAIYRRPRLTTDDYGEQIQVIENGLPAWDLTGDLPVKQHMKWEAKGFEYITLADRASLVDAWKKGTLPEGMTPKDYSQDPRTSGPWNYRKYVEGQAAHLSADLLELRTQIAEFGSDAVARLRGITLPAWLQGFKAGDDVPMAPPQAAATPPAPRQAVASPSEMVSTRATRPRRRKKAAEGVTS